MANPSSLYPHQVLQLIQRYSLTANQTSAALSFYSTNSISTEAILGPIMQEYAGRLSSTESQIKDAYVDSHLLTVHYEYGSHDTILNEYNAVSALTKEERYAIAKDPWGTGLAKFGDPIMFDVGTGNFQLYTAVRLLDGYANNYPNDPLNIAHYKNDYTVLLRDLANPNSNATVKFAALMIDEGLSWGKANAANWSDLTIEEQEGFAVYYYRAGRDKLEISKEEEVAATGKYTIDAENTDIIQEHIDNRVLAETLGYYNQIGDNEELRAESEKIFLGEYNIKEYCFVAGTPIDMADGSQRAIEQVRVGDLVLAYDPEQKDGFGNLAPAQVTRTYATPDKLVLDFHGVLVTPGHVFLCGDGPHKGKHRMLIDILRDDGAVVAADGFALRAATNAPIGSMEDSFLQVRYLPTRESREHKLGRMRAGTLLLTEAGETTSVLQLLESEGYAVTGDGLIARDGEAPQPLHWYGPLPRPEDYVLQVSNLSDADLAGDPDYIPEVSSGDGPLLGAGWSPAQGGEAVQSLFVSGGGAPKHGGETLH